jgi:hypothetical protein
VKCLIFIFAMAAAMSAQTPQYLPLTGGTMTGTLNGTKNLSFSRVTGVSDPAENAGAFGVTVNTPSVFGFTGSYSSCVINVGNGICYGASTYAQDGTDGSAYTHTVALNPQVYQPNTPTCYSGKCMDVYGVAAGFTLGDGLWPGSGFRVEGPNAGSGTGLGYGQVAVAYDMIDGISPVALYARPGCRNVTCNSASVTFQGRNSGVSGTPSEIYSDFLSNLRFQAPAAIVMTTGASATSSQNNASPIQDYEGSGWTGSASTTFEWGIQHTVSSPGIITQSHLEIMPPANLPSGVLPQVTIDPYLPASNTTNFDSPLLCNTASFWNGTAAAPDAWCTQVKLGTGTNPTTTYVIAHENGQGTSGSTSIELVSDAKFDSGVMPTGAGYKHVRLTGANVNCTAGAGGLCVNTAYTWGSAFADNNYTLTCMAISWGTGFGYVGVQSKSASGFTVVTGAWGSGTGAASEVDCTAVHD